MSSSKPEPGSFAYYDLVWMRLDAMKKGEEIIIKKKVAESNVDVFIMAVKAYIDQHKYGNGIEFSSDYSKVLKK